MLIRRSVSFLVVYGSRLATHEDPRPDLSIVPRVETVSRRAASDPTRLPEKDVRGSTVQSAKKDEKHGKEQRNMKKS